MPSRPPATSAIASSGIPAEAAASAAIRASSAFDRAAADDPRSTIALPDLRQRAVASIVTFGRASYTIATTPSGTRTLQTSSPLGSRQPSITSPTGSGNETILRTPATIDATRPGSSFSLSRKAKL